MITLYTWRTPNGRKPAIMLEEIQLPYTVKGVDITADEQFDPAFLALSPNNKIPRSWTTTRGDESRPYSRAAPS